MFDFAPRSRGTPPRCSVERSGGLKPPCRLRFGTILGPNLFFINACGYDTPCKGFVCSRGQAALRPRVSAVCGRLSLRAVPVQLSNNPRTTVPALTAPPLSAAMPCYCKTSCCPRPARNGYTHAPPAVGAYHKTAHASARDSSGTRTAFSVCMASACSSSRVLVKEKGQSCRPVLVRSHALVLLCEPLPSLFSRLGFLSPHLLL